MNKTEITKAKRLSEILNVPFETIVAKWDWIIQQGFGIRHANRDPNAFKTLLGCAPKEKQMDFTTVQVPKNTSVILEPIVTTPKEIMGVIAWCIRKLGSFENVKHAVASYEKLQELNAAKQSQS